MIFRCATRLLAAASLFVAAPGPAWPAAAQKTRQSAPSPAVPGAQQVPRLIELSLAAPLKLSGGTVSLGLGGDNTRFEAFVAQSQRLGLYSDEDVRLSATPDPAAHRFTRSQVRSAAKSVFEGAGLDPLRPMNAQQIAEVNAAIWERLLGWSPKQDLAAPAVPAAPRPTARVPANEEDDEEAASQPLLRPHNLSEESRTPYLQELWDIEGTRPQTFSDLLLHHMASLNIVLPHLAEKVLSDADSLELEDASAPENSLPASEKLALIAGASYEEDGNAVGFAPGEDFTERLAAEMRLSGKPLELFRLLARKARRKLPVLELTGVSAKASPAAAPSGRPDISGMAAARLEFYAYLERATKGEIRGPGDLTRKTGVEILLAHGLRRAGVHRKMPEDPSLQVWNALALPQEDKPRFHDLADRFFGSIERSLPPPPEGWKSPPPLSKVYALDPGRMRDLLISFREKLVLEKAALWAGRLTPAQAAVRAESEVDARWIGARAMQGRSGVTLFASPQAVERMVQEGVLRPRDGDYRDIPAWKAFREAQALTDKELAGYVFAPPNQRVAFLARRKHGSLERFGRREGFSVGLLSEITRSQKRLRALRPRTRARLASLLGIQEEDLFASSMRGRNRELLRSLDEEGALSPALRLKALRLANGLSRELLTERLKAAGLSLEPLSVSRLESDEGEPSRLRHSFWKIKQKYAEAFGITIKELIPLRKDLPAPGPEPHRNLRALMDHQGISEKELAQDTGISAARINNFGSRPGSLARLDRSELERLAAALGAKPEDILVAAP